MLNFKIETLSQELLPALYRYNKEIYPDKVISPKAYIDYWMSKTPEEVNNSIVLIDDDNTIHGQILTSGMSYYYKGSKTDTVWLYDLIVDEDLRQDAWGMDIIVECFYKHPQSCSTGSGPTALPIHLKLGNKMLGEIRKYVGIVNPLWLATSAFRGKVIINNFPKQVKTNGRTYLKIEKQDLPNLTKPYNETLWEPARDIAYLQWRYFNDLHDYAFYKDCMSDNYFVLRTIIQSHVTAMLLVDYRCDASTNEGFGRIYKAVSKVMNKVHLAVLITGSSLATIDSVLESHHFKSIGRPRPVIGFVKVKDRKADIDARKFAFVTLADSDGETNWL